MSELSEGTSNWPGFEIALEGDGVSPADVPVRQLAAVLEAVANLFEKVAAEREVKVLPPRLVEVASGSAAYTLRSPDVESEGVLQSVEQHARERGRNATHAVRSALDRLYRSGRDFGAIRLVRFEGKARLEPVHLAPPVELEPATFEEVRELLGVVVGVDAGARRGATVKLRIDDGGTASFDADIPTAQKAARLFTQPARALVVYEISGERETEGEIEQLDPWDRDDDGHPLAVFDQAAAALRDHGIHVRASDWLRELDDEN